MLQKPFIFVTKKQLSFSDLLENIDLYFNINEHLNKTSIEMVEIFDLIYMQNETFSFWGRGRGGET